MAESPRIEQLLRRVRMDPASTAFTLLADEYRRAGRYNEAISTLHDGLKRHPAYAAARVALGRTFMDMGRLSEARAEFEHALRIAPGNLGAVRGLAEIHERVRDSGEAVAAGPEKAAPDPAPVPAPSDRVILPLEPPAAANPAPAAFAAPPEAPLPDAQSASDPQTADQPGPAPDDLRVRALEAFLAAILRARSALPAASRPGVSTPR